MSHLELDIVYDQRSIMNTLKDFPNGAKDFGKIPISALETQYFWLQFSEQKFVREVQNVAGYSPGPTFNYN